MTNPNLYKGILQPIIIQLLKENRRMYGFEMTQRVKDLTKGKVKITEGALYPLLHKLEGEGVLESEKEFVDNRMRKYYKLTEKGKKKSARSFNEIQEFVGQLSDIFKLKLA